MKATGVLAKIADKKEQLRLLVEEQDLGSGNLQDNREYAELQAEIIKLEEQEANTLRTVSKRRAAILSSIEREKELLEELTLQKQISVDAELLGLQSIAELNLYLPKRKVLMTKKYYVPTNIANIIKYKYTRKTANL